MPTENDNICPITESIYHPRNFPSLSDLSPHPSTLNASSSSAVSGPAKW